MSWTSPFTVALIMTGRFPPSSPAFFMYGSRMLTASLITLADLTTWGRNIFPSPKSSPTFSMPAMRGPSITLTADESFPSASITSSLRLSSVPLTSMAASLSSRLPFRTEASAAAGEASFPASFSAMISEALATSLSVASGSLSRMTSSQHLRSSGSMPS